MVLKFFRGLLNIALKMFNEKAFHNRCKCQLLAGALRTPKTDGVWELHLDCGGANHLGNCPMPLFHQALCSHCGFAWVDRCALPVKVRSSVPSSFSTGTSVRGSGRGSWKLVLLCAAVEDVKLPYMTAQGWLLLPPMKPWDHGRLGQPSW